MAVFGNFNLRQKNNYEKKKFFNKNGCCSYHINTFNSTERDF